MAIALRAAGIGLGDHVLVNVFTLSPVPGAVDHVGATPVIVGIGADYTVDRDHLATSAKQSGATTLLLSHMRGHMAPMDDIVELCDELRLTLIEDRAHTMGAAWGTHRRADSVWLAASQPSRTNTSIAVRAACW
jgi:dTDP-4-amino-4,6-dideoxygalactose transaminase